MLVVKIELHSAVTGKVSTIATGKIINIGTGTTTQGNYRVELKDSLGRIWKTGTVEHFPRKRFLRGICWLVRFIPSWERKTDFFSRRTRGCLSLFLRCPYRGRV